LFSCTAIEDYEYICGPLSKSNSLKKIHHINKIKGQKIEIAIHHAAKVSSSTAKQKKKDAVGLLGWEKEKMA
jgi:hypothetical protein